MTGYTRILRTTGFRLAVLYAALFGISVIVLFGVIYWTADGALHQQLATNVENEVASLVDDYKNGGLSHTADAISLRLESDIRPTTFYLLLDPAGRKVAGNLHNLSPRDGWRDLPLPREEVEAIGGDPADTDGHSLLALGTTMPDGSFLLVGGDVFPIGEVEEAIVRALGWGLAVTMLLAAAGGGILSVGFLRRLDAINRTSRAIIKGRLTDRVPTRGTDDELDRLAVNLNEMLDRVQALMESLRQVSNDIAHDLRTPLSRLRQRLEDMRLRPRDTEYYEVAVDEAITDADSILETFSALLRIAQIEAGTRRSAFSPLDLSALFQSIADTYEAVAEDRGQVLTASIEPDVQIRGDRELLTQMLANLVENAICHAPEGTGITLRLEHGPSGPIGSVADTGPGIPPEARDKVFRRFFRLERSRSTPGSGLGLSLVMAVAEIHDIAVALTGNEPGLKVILDFPSAASPPEPT